MLLLYFKGRVQHLVCNCTINVTGLAPRRLNDAVWEMLVASVEVALSVIIANIAREMIVAIIQQNGRRVRVSKLRNLANIGRFRGSSPSSPLLSCPIVRLAFPSQPPHATQAVLSTRPTRISPRARDNIGRTRALPPSRAITAPAARPSSRLRERTMTHRAPRPPLLCGHLARVGLRRHARAARVPACARLGLCGGLPPEAISPRVPRRACPRLARRWALGCTGVSIIYASVMPIRGIKSRAIIPEDTPAASACPIPHEKLRKHGTPRHALLPPRYAPPRRGVVHAGAGERVARFLGLPSARCGGPR